MKKLRIEAERGKARNEAEVKRVRIEQETRFREREINQLGSESRRNELVHLIRLG